MVQSKILAKYSEILHYFGDKKDTSSIEGLGIKLEDVISAEQIHGNKVVLLKSGKNKFLKGADGMITYKTLILSIRTADCMPIFFYDPGEKIIAVVHAGWKGLYRGIIEKAILEMKKISSNPQNIIVAIGPHIHNCCYNIPKERIEIFKKYKDAVWENFLNLSEIALQQMESKGLLRKNIEISPVCTSCDENFWSFRRDGGKTGRMINLLGFNAC